MFDSSLSAFAVATMMATTAPFLIWQPLERIAAEENERSPASDHELTQQAAEGDMWAFEELHLRHNQRVYSLRLRTTQNVSEAEDPAQEVFVQLFLKIGSLRGDPAFTTWLHRLTANRVLMHFRERSMRDERTTDEGEMPGQAVLGTENPSRMQVMDRAGLNSAIAPLPPGYHMAFVLHDVEGREHEEITRPPGCAAGTSKSQPHKARMKLRKPPAQQKPPEEALPGLTDNVRAGVDKE